MLSRATWIVLAALCCTGCATRERYDELVRGWVGHDSDALARSWGPPSSKYALNNGNQLHLYETNSVESYTSPTQIYQAPGTVVGGTFYPGPTTVTISAPDSSMAWRITSFEEYLPVPTMSRELKSLPPSTRLVSYISTLRSIPRPWV